MNATAITAGIDDDATPGFLVKFAVEHVERWLVAGDQVRAWHRQHILERDPHPEDLKDFKRALPFLLATTRMLNARVHEPHWANREQARRMEAYVWQLEQMADSIENPMSDPEADKVLTAAFPE